MVTLLSANNLASVSHTNPTRSIKSEIKTYSNSYRKNSVSYATEMNYNLRFPPVSLVIPTLLKAAGLNII